MTGLGNRYYNALTLEVTNIRGSVVMMVWTEVRILR